MIVEGYDLHLYCDGPHKSWELAPTLGLACTGEFGGRNRREAWASARRQGWTKARNKAYCCDCSAARERDRQLRQLNKKIRETENSGITPTGSLLGGGV